MDLVELAYTMWWRRRDGLLAFGPDGLAGMTQALAQLMAPDVSLRTGGNQPTPNPLGYRVSATEISEGIVFEKDGLIIEAFDVNHGHVKPAYGYKITTTARTPHHRTSPNLREALNPPNSFCTMDFTSAHLNSKSLKRSKQSGMAKSY